MSTLSNARVKICSLECHDKLRRPTTYTDSRSISLETTKCSRVRVEVRVAPESSASRIARKFERFGTD